VGRASAADAAAVVDGVDTTTATGARVRGWSLVASHTGGTRATGLASSDVWRQTAGGTGTVRLQVEQDRAPESVVVAAPDGGPADLGVVTVTIASRAWFFQALLLALVGLLVVAVGVGGLWHLRPARRRGAAVQDPDEGVQHEEVAA
jgi:hypothetical protein